MKKFFEYLGLITLVCFSFFYTEKTTSVVKELDDIMIKIKEVAPKYTKEVEEAIIDGDTIIPGISGKKVDINASYQSMRKLGTFNENYLEYEYIKPKELLKNNLDKYIIGASINKKQVSLIFLVDDRSKIDDVLKILNNYEIEANFFVDGNWFEDNNDTVIELIENKHIVGNLSYNRDYGDSSFIWMDTIIKKIGKQNNSYCYKTDNKKDLENCALQKDYTISPKVEIDEYPLINVKNNLSSGSIISFKINNSLIKELDLIIKYIRSKDLEIVNLKTLLNEN